MLTINNERIEQRKILRNMGERMSPEEEERLMKIVVENNEKIIKLQKQLGELQVGEKKRQKIMRQREEEEARSREKKKEMDRWVEECRKRNEKEREEKEEKKKVDEE